MLIGLALPCETTKIRYSAYWSAEEGCASRSLEAGDESVDRSSELPVLSGRANLGLG